MARRPLAALLVVGVGALTLSGCLILPPPIPEAPVLPTAAPLDPTVEPLDPSESGEADPGQPVDDLAPTAAFGEPVTIDDGAGDAWTVTVTQVEPDPPLQGGGAAAGTRIVAVVLDAERVEGEYPFLELFEIFVVGSDGVAYDYFDTIAEITPENDVYLEEGDSFTGARAAVQLPEGVDPTHVVVRSYYGHPEVADTVIAVQ
jgi:hypothetical protein